MNAPSAMPAPVLIWCPFPDADTAHKVARALVEGGLVACANILPAMQSLYQWPIDPERGVVEEAQEVGVLFKTNAKVQAEAMARLAQWHPYAEPAILAWECPSSWPATAQWLAGLGGENGAGNRA